MTHRRIAPVNQPPSPRDCDIQGAEESTSWSTPLLFAEPRKEIGCCKRRSRTSTEQDIVDDEEKCARPSRRSVLALDCAYPMFVISVKDLLQLESIEPHQVLLHKGLLCEWTPDMGGRIIFVSHEWLGWNHADPNGQQFATLQRLLTRLSNGEIAKVESNWRQQLVFKQNTVITAKQWKSALVHMFVWMDFLCIPQMGARGTAEDTADQAGSAALSAAQQETATNLKKAVESIPAYIERTSLLLVLVPVCQHQDRQEACSYATWIARGWCILELQAALLKCGAIQVMVCTGAETTPDIFPPFDALKLVCGPANFTCCQKGHMMNGALIECDKAKVKKILEAMILNKMTYLETLGDMDQYRWVSCLRSRLLYALPDDGWWHVKEEIQDKQQDVVTRIISQQRLSQGELPAGSERIIVAEEDTVRDHAPAEDAASRLRARLKWHPQDDVRAKQSGRSLLTYAAMVDDKNAVLALLEQSNAADLHSSIVKPHPDVCELPATPLIAAMAFGSFEVARQLIQARADPGQRVAGFDALSMAIVGDRIENIRDWLLFFCSSLSSAGWQLERLDKVMDGNVLNHAAGMAGPAAEKIVKMFLVARADAQHRNALGDTALLSRAQADSSAPHLVRLLVQADVDVNAQLKARTFKWRSIVKVAQLAMRCGSGSQLLAEIAMWEGTTALMFAARSGKVAEMHEMLLLRADITLLDGYGRTALEVARQKFEGILPPLVEELLVGRVGPAQLVDNSVGLGTASSSNSFEEEEPGHSGMTMAIRGFRNEQMQGFAEPSDPAA